MAIMSTENIASTAEGEQAMSSTLESSKPTYKSWKKKFRKMKYQFDQVMRDCDHLYQEELKGHETARRIAEMNNMILEVLLDVNSSNHIDPRLRIDLGSATLRAPGPSEVPGLDTDDTQTSEDDPAPIRSFQSLLITPHASLASVQEEDLPEDLTAEKPATYLGIDQEEDYYVHLDRLLGNSPVPLIPELASTGEKSSDKEKDINVRNPMSVYNWLRKHQPQVFLQDHEVSSDKSAKTGDKRGAGKRASIAAAKATPEYLDEDGISYGADSSSAFGSRGKRKRDDDPSYRSKGGRPTKRKREDSAAGGKKLRKATNVA